jgi:two-component system chemotaxis response regulator CheY
MEQPDMSKRILIVDDSASVRQVAGIALTRAGYEVIEACDGQDALAKLAGKVHLIISDVNMPRMDGISFLKAVKAHPNYKFTPVIMLTTEAGEDKKNEGRAAGAKAWIVKPFQPQTMLDAVAKLCMA